VEQLRRGIAGQLADADLAELAGHRIEHFRKIGNTVAEYGSPERRTLALPGLDSFDWPPISVDVEYCARFPWSGGRHPMA
jgi:hypothetical protein